MMEDWKEVILEDLGFVGRGKSRHRPRNAEFLYGGNYPFVQTANVKAANYKITDFTQTYSYAGLKQSKLWPKDTLCITIAANIADAAILDIEACFPDSVIGFIADSNKSDVRFVKYLFDLLQARIKKISQGAAQDNLSLEKLRTIKFLVPPLPTQRKIASILSAYDDLIENNLKRIKLLEEKAQLTYEEWFVRMKFPGHETTPINPETGLPDGWKKVKLTDHIELLRGIEPGSKNYKESINHGLIPFIRVGDLSKKRSKIFVSKDIVKNKIAKTTDVLLSLDGSPGLVVYGLEGAYSTGVRKAVSKNINIKNSFIFAILSSGKIQGLIRNHATGSTILHAGGSVKHMSFEMPTQNILDKFTDLSEDIFFSILSINKQNDLLKEARDILLPRLMTGMIDVEGINLETPQPTTT